MNLLALDTSGPVCGVAVMKDDCVVCEHSVINKNTHSVNLMPMIDDALTQAGLTLSGLDRLAVVVGPGSFTGVRIGVSTAKGLMHGAGLLCAPVNALEAMAAGIFSFDGLVCPVQDARAGQVYGAAFTVKEGRPQRLWDDEPIRVEDLTERLKVQNRPCLFLGDGMPVHREKLIGLLGERAVFAPPQLCNLRPAAVAYLGSLCADPVPWEELQPLYLRAPNAERNKKLMEAAAHA